MNRFNEDLIKHLNVFETFLKSIPNDEEDNIVLAGVCVLKAHGLILSRKASDLDVVIFNPTKQQEDYIKSFKFFEVPNNQVPDSCYQQRSYKFKKEEKWTKDPYFLDVLMAYDTNLPDGLLYYNHNNFMYKMQNIHLNILAKASYSNEFNSDSGLKENYCRTKDVKDILDLKNLNFNF